MMRPAPAPGAAVPRRAIVPWLHKWRSTMEGTKSAAGSLTVQSLILGVLVQVAKAAGFDLAETDAATLVSIVLMAVALYGRLRATKRIA